MRGTCICSFQEEKCTKVLKQLEENSCFYCFLANPPLFNICNRKEIISCPIPESCLLNEKQIFITMDCFASVYPVTLGACPSEQLCSAVLARSLECEDIPVAGGGTGCRELWFGPTQWLKMTSAAVNDKLAAIFWFILSELTGLDFKPQFLSPAGMKVCQPGITWCESCEQ